MINQQYPNDIGDNNIIHEYQKKTQVEREKQKQKEKQKEKERGRKRETVLARVKM